MSAKFAEGLRFRFHCYGLLVVGSFPTRPKRVLAGRVLLVICDIVPPNWIATYHLNVHLTVMRERLLNIEGTINFRDLGGYVGKDQRLVRWGQMYRSAKLDRLTQRGIADMAALGIKTVIDLRFSDETANHPTIREAVPEAEILSWHDEHQASLDADANAEDGSLAMQASWRDSLNSQDPVKVREAMRLNYPKKLYSHRAIYRKMLLRLSSQRTPLVFHCAAGKDRTGVAAALILSLLGVSDQQIIDDYLLTQLQVANLVDGWLAGGATDANDYQAFQKKVARHSRAVIQPIFDADVAYIETLLNYVETTYSGFRNYAVQVLELSDQHILSLQSQLLTDAVSVS